MPRNASKTSALIWSDSTELVALVFQLVPQQNATLIPQYTTGLHAWFLKQVRQIDPALSQYLHDGQSEKPFTISGLSGQIITAGQKLLLSNTQSYQWRISALSSPVVEWMAAWVKNLPSILKLRAVTFEIQSVKIAEFPTTYEQLLQSESQSTLPLSFLSPTSFRRKGHHFPLPVPNNVFQSYLRRWNDFSHRPYEPDAFLEWIDANTIILRHHLESKKVAVGKKGSVTGFTGAIEYGLTANATDMEYRQLFFALGRLANYCGTGHKTTFGLGQTRLGWSKQTEMESLPLQTMLAQRIEQISDRLMQHQKRTGGTRAIQVCQKRATILARQERGESLSAIAQDLEMPYETVKTYAKLARKFLDIC